MSSTAVVNKSIVSVELLCYIIANKCKSRRKPDSSLLYYFKL